MEYKKLKQKCKILTWQPTEKIKYQNYWNKKNDKAQSLIIKT